MDVVVPMHVVIVNIFLAFNEGLKVEELVVGANVNLIIAMCSRSRNTTLTCMPGSADVFLLASIHLTEEGVKRLISSLNGLVTCHLVIRLNIIFQEVDLSANTDKLDSSPANVE